MAGWLTVTKPEELSGLHIADFLEAGSRLTDRFLDETVVKPHVVRK